MKHSSVKTRRAIPFIMLSNEGIFSIQSEGAKLFETQSDPFGVIAMTGLNQTGKSTLLNQLINEKGTFKVEDNVQSCTKGIWITRISY